MPIHPEVSDRKLAACHQLQLEGMDYQSVAYDLDLVNEDGEIIEVGSPDPGCECNACRKALRERYWVNENYWREGEGAFPDDYR